MSTVMVFTSLGLRFLLELSALGALGRWGFDAGEGELVRWTLGIGVPLTAAVVWGTFVSPEATVVVSRPVRIGLEAAVFGAAVAALAGAGSPGWAVVFGLTALVNGVFVHVRRII